MEKDAPDGPKGRTLKKDTPYASNENNKIDTWYGRVGDVN